MVAAACMLNFTSYLYQPSGDCIGDNKNIKFWGTISSRLCCRNALTAFSESLAVQANRTNGDIFINKDQWRKCDGPFLRQESVSIDSCGFDDFYYGNSQCSSLSLPKIQSKPSYQNAFNACSNLGSSFDYSCKKCTDAIGNAVENLLEIFRSEKIHTERALCGLSVVISVAAANVDNHSFVADFLSCMSSLDDLDTIAKVLIEVIVVLIIVMLILILVKYVSTKKRKGQICIHLPTPIKAKEYNKCSGLYSFSKAEIDNAISCNRKKKSLGKGSAGEVFEGILPSGQLVAIKHINRGHSPDSFKREVAGLSRIRHPNLVSMLGCCIDGEEHYLVLEYCSAGNLAQHLLRKDSGLTWDRRVKILRDCAFALRYLHHYMDGCIVHRDIKLTNILLTEDFEPKLSDFGLAKMLGMEESKVFTDVRGTIGYMDPEYMTNAMLTCASDIYSFGIVALQLLSGQKVFELDLDASDQLTRKAKDVSMGKRPQEDFEDPRLKGKLNRADFEAILHIAVLCVAKSSTGRPTIDIVFDEMERAWKSTLADMRAKNGTNSSETPTSTSLEVLSV
ncbi:hypothetical protein CCACVL1_10717 [Corchorus capsularis]|uniref:non-specific serine/threonine protein kinase n=1 Tax=Corchorus capsularis TaxID=210143 RepID=A0A1R3IQ88_COCAP|nr:hypothetical protein CCACVL1_10717 [Corchorus capsularis]